MEDSQVNFNDLGLSMYIMFFAYPSLPCFFFHSHQSIKDQHYSCACLFCISKIFTVKFSCTVTATVITRVRIKN